MKGVYILAIMMFLGLFLMFYSQYQMMNIVGQRTPAGAKSPKNDFPAVMITDPEIQPYVTGSFVGLALFIVGAIGGVIAIVKIFTRRF